MLKKTALFAAAAASTLVAMPAAAEAQRYGYYDSRYDRYDSRYNRAYNDRYASRDRYYGSRSYDNGYYNRNYNNNYYGQRRCSGTTGTIVGGVAGALLGREITRSNSRYGRGNSGTTGAIIGGAVGALAGRAIDKSNC